MIEHAGSANIISELQKNGVPRFDNLSGIDGIKLFGEGHHAVSVPLRRAPGARVLWLNQRAMTNDPAFHTLGGDIAAFCAHLTAACGYVEPGWFADQMDEDCNEFVTAYADRYGGAGIGNHGGSGRAALVNGYLVKGIGKTPLIGATTNEFSDLMHTSGIAYLEECVLEAIFSEIISLEFPHSAIPTLAIIDTGIMQIWETDAGPKCAKSMLLVRPCFLRPAHFERAPGFHSANPKEGARDFSRVQHIFDNVVAFLGKQQLKDQFAEFLNHWTQQLAYAYVHRVSTAGNSTSNICFDGKATDFGAWTALPSWAQIMTVPGSRPAGNEFVTFTESVQSLCYFFGRCHAPAMGQPAYVNQVIQNSWATYLQTVSVEVLRLCGLPRHVAQAGLNGLLQDRIYDAVNHVFARYRKERFDVYAFTPSPAVPWDLADVWLEKPPSHLVELRSVLDELSVGAALGVAQQRCRFISRSRPNLYREELKGMLNLALGKAPLPGETEQDIISRIIYSVIAEGRRDVRVESENAIPLGFAVSDQFSLAMYRCTRSDTQFAVIEWETEGFFASLGKELSGLFSMERAGCLALHSWDGNSVTLGKMRDLQVPCVVSAQQ